jgi:hypothetical protein
MKELSLTPEMLTEAVMKAKLTPQMKETILSELPEFMEHIDEATRKIFDPSAVWLECLQFADYVSQMAQHLLDNHGPECTEQVGINLKIMADSWKDLAEGSMEVLDQSEKVFEDGA